MQSPLTNPRNMRRYLITLGTGVSLIVVSMVCLNIIVDPYGIYRGFESGWSAHHRAGFDSRISTAERLKQQTYHTVIFGTSRAAAVNENSPILGGQKTLNASLSGASASEIETVARYAVETGGVKRVILLVDFFQFNMRDPRPAEIDRSLFNSKLTWVEYHGDKILGSAVTETSAGKLWQSWKELGGQKVVCKAAAASQAAMPRARFEGNARHYLKSPMMFQGFRYSAVELEKFRETVRLAHARNVDLHIAINPIHVIQLETVRAAGLWERFEGWKRDITRIVAEENQLAGQNTPLWDFTGYKSYPAEPMPAADCPTPPVYYTEGSHFTTQLAEIMLSRMFQSDPCDPAFGIRLHTSNIEQQLVQIREDYYVWRETNVPDIEWLQRIAVEYGHTPPTVELSSRNDRAVRK